MSFLNSCLLVNKDIKTISDTNDITLAFTNKLEYIEGDFSLKSIPFQVCEIRNFLANDKDITFLVEELNSLEFCKRNNDLYSFKQTCDLNYVHKEFIAKFRNLLISEFKEYLEKVTSIKLKPEINITSSKYQANDMLLCHDDELDTRRIAFTFYLTDYNWKKEFGGLLRLFETNEVKDVTQVVREIIPLRNTMVWFEVSEDSYHEVSEVICTTNMRLSIHGWFHSEPVPRKVRNKDPVFLYEMSPIHVELELVYNWISGEYLDTSAQDKIRKKFENQSEIQLLNFLKEDKYSNLLEIFDDANLTWEDVGPPNKRKYKCLSKTQNTELSNFIDLFRSEAMLLILSNFTGLNLHPLYEEKNSLQIEKDEDDIPNKRLKTQLETNLKSRYNYEVRCWTHGCYQLMHDADSQAQFSLDAFIYFTRQNIDFEVGGYTSYVSNDDGEQLLTVEPNKNCLNLVYREKDTRKFVKYVNNKIIEQNLNRFYDVNFSYVENE